MANGIYTAVSGSVVQLQRLEVLANNLSNARTTGFRAEDVVTREVRAEPTRDPSGAAAPETTAYAQVEETFVRRGPGELHETSNPLDLALTGPGFLRLETEGGERLTRDGRLVLRRDGLLQTLHGDAVLSSNGERIILPPDRVPVIEKDGAIRHGNTVLARIGIAIVPDTLALEKDPTGRFLRPGEARDNTEGTPVEVALLQGHLEDANVEPVRAMTELIELQRQFEALHQVIGTQGELDRRAIQLAGR